MTNYYNVKAHEQNNISYWCTTMGSKLAVDTALKGELGVTVDRFIKLSAQCSMTYCTEDIFCFEN